MWVLPPTTPFPVASSRCCCAPSPIRRPCRTTTRRSPGSIRRPRAVRLSSRSNLISRRRRTPPLRSLASRTSASWRPGCSSALSSGPGTFHSFPTFRCKVSSALYIDIRNDCLRRDVALIGDWTIFAIIGLFVVIFVLYSLYCIFKIHAVHCISFSLSAIVLK